MRNFKRQSGFTIVEIMIIVTIIGVLAALVLPNARASANRARMAEAILAFGPCRSMITEIYGGGGESPGADNWGCEIPANASRYVFSVRTDETGKIILLLRGTGDPRIDNRDLTLQPLDNTGAIPNGNGAPVTRWRCGDKTTDGTEVSAQFLPSSCRG